MAVGGSGIERVSGNARGTSCARCAVKLDDEAGRRKSTALLARREHGAASALESSQLRPTRPGPPAGQKPAWA
jgi:hypothetical protein